MKSLLHSGHFKTQCGIEFVSILRYTCTHSSPVLLTCDSALGWLPCVSPDTVMEALPNNRSPREGSELDYSQASITLAFFRETLQ
jgi:hypothetical protein